MASPAAYPGFELGSVKTTQRDISSRVDYEVYQVPT